ALETNKYNHISATYYLLAERILREKQEKEVQTRSSSPSNIKAHFRSQSQLYETECDVQAFTCWDQGNWRRGNALNYKKILQVSTFICVSSSVSVIFTTVC
ncbi:hypothetical protein ATANTOWER_027828, partial [Ataeniobius toweri]|nr:hypothetical protein [Ataeniobius toweri]